MEKERATRFQHELETAHQYLLKGLSVAEEGGDNEELSKIRKGLGIIIGRLDEVLHDAIYRDYPDLDPVLKAKPE